MDSPRSDYENENENGRARMKHAETVRNLKEHPVNLYFGSPTDMADINTKDNASQAYVILQNNQLFSENAKLRSKVEKLKSDREILMTDYDNMDKSKTCLKGLLHNEVEINGIREQICKVYSDDLKAIVSRAYYFVGEMLLALAVLTFTVAAGNQFSPEYSDLLYTSQLSLFAGLFVSTVMFVLKLDTTNLSDLESSLKAASKASDNLHCIIDEI